MMNAKSIVALVPMRHHSERVPGKNYRPLAGKPLYAHILESLLACPQIDQVVVDTDSATIREGIGARFEEVILLDRPEHLRAGEVPMNAVLRHDVEQVPADFYLQTHSTNPLLTADTICRAIEAFQGSYPEKDSLFSVTRWQTRLWDAQGQAINHDPKVLLRTQDLAPIYEENSCIYIFERDRFLDSGNRIGSMPLMFEIARDEAVDIDEEFDFHMAEVLLAGRVD